MSNITGSPAAVHDLDRSPVDAEWFVLDVVRATARKWDWVALMVDVDPDDLKNYACEFPALFYVNPNEYRPGHRKARQCWVRRPGKYRNRDAAYDALDEMMSTRH